MGVGNLDLKASQIEEILGDEADFLLNHICQTIPKEKLHLPSKDWVDRIFSQSDRNNRVLRNLQTIFNSGTLARSGYLSILPVDQGVEHSAGGSFSLNPEYFDPENIILLAIEGGCNAVASTYGVLSILARRYAHKIPFILKLNHNELLSYPNTFDQIFFANIHQAYEMGAVAVGATIYFGSSESSRQIIEVSKAFSYAHELGMATILWCYLRNPAFKTTNIDFHSAADLTGQANHLGATLGADIVKQKLPTNNGGFQTLNFGHTNDQVYSKLSSDHPIDLCRYQVVNSYMGRIGLINSGGPSGKEDFAAAARTAVINKRAGGMGLISGRKAFQRSMKSGIQLLNMIQSIYLNSRITIA
ncbi:MAG: class I fructose-bisphosphate aldolase [Chlamydiales bacterium]